VKNALGKGVRTGDIMQPGMTRVSTTEMGNAVLGELEKLS
jgi:3-isopropylmalate dehydrogenase